MNKYFALRKANRMRTKLLNEKSQEQLKEVIRYLRRVSWDFCGIELVRSDLLDISIQANAENQELFDSISDARSSWVISRRTRSDLMLFVMAPPNYSLSEYL